ncbi:hypothetical protein [Mycoplasma sp. SG1]|uniref:hypothetical protein n=1 Tax=Mycoplasma sp. SG1 TaxID=2810348 RepID=UPI002023CB2B|nr:hypothetical protein [Mycoplasma sp. SG1]URM52990.1 hypothetical protein JRW51_01430 [Mycoplasma sp. SG1]
MIKKFNEKKLYYIFQIFLKNNKVNDDVIKNSKIYKKLISIGFVEKTNFWIVNITSMCLEKNPEQLRIRNDNFLTHVKNNSNCCILSAIKIENKILYLIFFGKSFYGYNFKNDVGNSFINFNYSELINLGSYENDIIQTKNVREKTKYYFYTSIDNNFDKDKFITFWDLINSTKFDPYNLKNSKLDPNIPEKTKEYVATLFNEICSLYDTNGHEYCKSNINWEEYKKIGRKCYEIHHFVPKKIF